MKLIERKKCISCEGSLSLIHKFNNFPIYMGVTKDPITSDISGEMVFGYCIKCYNVQLMKLVPLEILYAKPHNAAIGKMWDKHHCEFYEFINPYFSSIEETTDEPIGPIELITNNLIL